MVFPIICETKQIDLEDFEIINMVVAIHIEEKKVILEEDITTKIN